jgi:O-antigen/teichoic acid export membrane protein
MNSIRHNVTALLRKWRNKFASSPLAHRLTHGAFWTLSGNTMARALAVLTTMMVTRILGKESYGKVSIIQNTVDVFVTAGSLGLSFTATKHIAEFRKVDPSKTGRIIAMTSVVSWLSGGLFSLILLLSAPWLARDTLHAPDMTMMLRTAACLLFFATVNGAQIGSLSGFEAFRRRAKINVIASLVALPFTVAGTYFFGPQGTIDGFIVAAAVLCSMNAVAVRQEARQAGVLISRRGWSQEASLVLKFGIPVMASSLIASPANWLCNTLLVRTNGGFKELGLYNAANQWFNALMFLPSALSVVSIPILSELIRENRWQKVSRLTWKSVSLHALIIIPAIVLAAISPWIMRAYGRDFAGGSSVMILQLGTAVVVALHAPIWPVLLTAGKLRPVILMNVGWAFVFIVLSWYGVHWGAIGLAGARFFAYLLYTIGMFGLAYNLIRKGRDRESGEVPAVAAP